MDGFEGATFKTKARPFRGQGQRFFVLEMHVLEVKDIPRGLQSCRLWLKCVVDGQWCKQDHLFKTVSPRAPTSALEVPWDQYQDLRTTALRAIDCYQERCSRKWEGTDIAPKTKTATGKIKTKTGQKWSRDSEQDTRTTAVRGNHGAIIIAPWLPRTAVVLVSCSESRDHFCPVLVLILPVAVLVLGAMSVPSHFRLHLSW